MTTMTEKLLAKAEQYEQKAQALRFAAAEMNGDATATKQKTVVGTLEAAIALRKAQSNGHQSAPPAAPGRQGKKLTQATLAERQATIRACLAGADGPQTTRAIQQALEKAGQDCSTSWVLKLLHDMTDVHKVGSGIKAAWAPGKKQRASPGSRLPEKQAARALTAKVLDHYDRETPTSPSDVAKALGMTVPKTGFAPLVYQGYLKKRKGGYVRTAKPYVVAGDRAASAQP